MTDTDLQDLIARNVCTHDPRSAYYADLRDPTDADWSDATPEGCGGCDCCFYGRHALAAALDRATRWQPIETAPRDGTHFLAVTRSGKQRVDWREPQQGPWSARNSQFWQERPKDRYTHWKPLGPNPEEA